MTNVLGYARTFFTGGVWKADQLATLEEEVRRFHEVLNELAAHLRSGTSLIDVELEQLLQGPLADAMTHAGQLAMLRRLSGSPVPPEDFVFAEVSAGNLGPHQPMPAAPDADWDPES
jgi:hypothetical protein